MKKKHIDTVRQKKRSKWSQWKKEHNKSAYYILTQADIHTAIEKNLNITDMLILAMINSSDGNGECFIKDQTFADMLHKSKSTIQHSLIRLRKAGLIRTYTRDKFRYIEATKFDAYRGHCPVTEEEWLQKMEEADSLAEPPKDYKEGGLVETT